MENKKNIMWLGFLTLFSTSIILSSELDTRQDGPSKFSSESFRKKAENRLNELARNNLTLLFTKNLEQMEAEAQIKLTQIKAEAKIERTQIEAALREAALRKAADQRVAAHRKLALTALTALARMMYHNS